jgi:6-phosphogluconolactonase
LHAEVPLREGRIENSEVRTRGSQSTNPDAPACNDRPTNPEEPPHNSRLINPEEPAHYNQQIDSKEHVPNDRPVFDLIILGLGDDGHTASIFPDQLDLLETDLVCAVAHHPVSGQARVTLTAKQINHASEICFLVTGANKAERLSEIALNGEEAKLLPASYIHPENGELFWYCDATAMEFLL